MKKLLIGGLVGSLLFVFLSVVGGLAALSTTHGFVGFHTHRGEYESLVQQAQALRTSAPMDAFMTDPMGSGSLLTVTPYTVVPRGSGAGRVWITSAAPGEVHAWIQTVDWGHAGSYGYAYSSDGSVPTWQADDYGERWDIGRSISKNWWIIAFNLD